MKSRAVARTCRDALASKLRQSIAITTTRGNIGIIVGPAAAARSAGVRVIALRLSTRSAEMTRRRLPLMVTSNLSGPRPVTGTPSRSITCTSIAIRSRLDRNVVGGFCPASCAGGDCAPTDAGAALNARKIANVIDDVFIAALFHSRRGERPSQHRAGGAMCSILCDATIINPRKAELEGTIAWWAVERHTFASCAATGTRSLRDTIRAYFPDLRG